MVLGRALKHAIMEHAQIHLYIHATQIRKRICAVRTVYCHGAETQFQIVVNNVIREICEAIVPPMHVVWIAAMHTAEIMCQIQEKSVMKALQIAIQYLIVAAEIAQILYVVMVLQMCCVEKLVMMIT